MAALDRGDRREAVAERFSVSVPTITRWVRLRRETGGLAPKPVPGPPAVKLGALLDALPGRLADRADATLEEQCSWWWATAEVEVSTATMSRAITALGWTRKKDAERERTRQHAATGLEQAGGPGRSIGLGLAR